MPYGRKGTASVGLHFVLSILCGLWLWAFMPPMEDLGLITNAGSFLPLFICIVLLQLVPWRLVRVLVVFVLSFVYMGHYFGPTQGSWLSNAVYILRQDISQVVSILNRGVLDDPLQTHVFVFVMAGLYWLIVYASQRLRLWLFYNFLGILLLAVVDANTPVHPNQAIVWVLLIGLLILGVAHYLRLQPGLVDNLRMPFAKFSTPLVGFILIGALVGAVLPKQDAVWGNPFANGFGAGDGNGTGNGKGGGKGQQMIGYQSDDSHLGGSFIMDNTQVLQVKEPVPSYLRGQVLTVYTGKGWLPGAATNAMAFTDNVPNASQVFFTKRLPAQSVNQTITILSPQVHSDILFGSYAVSHVQPFQDGSGFSIEMGSGNIYTRNLHQGDTYTVTSREPASPDALFAKEAPWDGGAKLGPDVQMYLQLPAGLPDRIRNLTAQIVHNDKTEYQMVYDVQTYLKLTYPYQIQGIPVPQGNQDYVDQFLFDSKKGYCNNFSSAMAVMLRTLNIPTRWVTGYATGTLDTAYSGPTDQFIVKNSDAHSWVEVYFPEVGWIPFDPTPNFDFPYTVSAGTTNPNPDSGNGGKTQKTPQPTKPQVTPESTNTTASSFSWTNLLDTVLWVLGATAAIGALVSVIFRRRIRSARHVWVWGQPSPKGMGRAILHLVRLLYRYGDIPSEGATTLRDLHRVAKNHGIEEPDYVHLVKTAESAWYGGKPVTDKDVEQVHRTWRSWVLSVISRGW